MDYPSYLISAAFLLYVWYRAIKEKEYLWIIAIVPVAIVWYLFANVTIFNFIPQIFKSFILILFNATCIGLIAVYYSYKQK
ncbi:hypothetical protein D1B31_01350 [Neobacillus notoginsengisoli]|uniref:Uncharacterized protein n=1 Tax=Neobacillus notoginsengisoli TaxID=1578198 RepID=A0A417YZP8_9BACI|nr:hypothetical protein [Neobacillus notoginsengisoli]RHW43342.1 hypothetical protein D1B31_01350 [Neobacillus notoginsengisoli]